MKRILLAILVCSLLVLVACASSSVSEDKSDDAMEEEAMEEEAMEEEAMEEEKPKNAEGTEVSDAHALAILNSGDLALPADDPSVAEFDALLKSISAKVSQDRDYVSEATAGSSKYVGDSTLLEILESVDKRLPDDATDEDFNQYIGYALATLGDLPE